MFLNLLSKARAPLRLIRFLSILLEHSRLQIVLDSYSSSKKSILKLVAAVTESVDFYCCLDSPENSQPRFAELHHNLTTFAALLIPSQGIRKFSELLASFSIGEIT